MNSNLIRFRIYRITRSIGTALLMPVALLTVILLLFASMFRRVKLVQMNVSRIGHLGVDTEYVLSELKRQRESERPLLVFIPWRTDLPVANRALCRLWKREVLWIPSWFGRSTHALLRLMRIDEKFMYQLPKGIASHPQFNWGTDPYGVTATGGPHLRFRVSEQDSAESRLQAMGIDLRKPIVTIHIRDGSYHPSHSSKMWHELHSWRNVDVNTAASAALALADRGFQVIRIGVHTSQPFLAADECNIFDYARNGHRDELVDIYLSSITAFMISTSSGIDSLTQVFRIPLYNVGVIAPSQLYIHRRITSIFQRFRQINDSRVLTLRESFKLGKISDETLRELGLEVVANTAEEICGLALEASDRYRKVWKPSAEDIWLQQRLLSLLPSAYRQFPIRGGVGAHFLRSHPEWLD
jgi:putative glycosyltransferase (TIGR04372 family)